VYFDREAVGEGQGRAGAGHPARVAGTSEGSWPVRSGTSRQDRDVGPSRAVPGEACGTQ
jgi:hypothetical protein